MRYFHDVSLPLFHPGANEQLVDQTSVEEIRIHTFNCCLTMRRV